MLAAFSAAAVVGTLWSPPPLTHDEFSYLLAAEPFAGGRLANLPHPMGVHFESFHLLQQPMYVSKYPPLQGMFMALGLLLGKVSAGVWISFALACGASCWMLRAWVGPVWALVGGLVLALHPQLVSVWGTWLWGGAAAMIGGMLVYGALPRLLARTNALASIMLGLGGSAFVLTRPYEGLAACVPAAALLAHDLFWRGRVRDGVRRLWPAAAVGAMAAAFLALYDYRTTGAPFTLPYTIYSEQYAGVPPLVFLPLAEATGTPNGSAAVSPHAAIREFFATRYRFPALALFAPGGFESRPYYERRTPAGFVRGLGEKLEIFWRFFALVALPLPLLALPFVWRDRQVRFAAVGCTWFALALAVETYEQRHYAAPGVALGLVVWVSCLRAVTRWRPVGRPVGVALFVGVLCVAFVEHGVMARSFLERRARSPLMARPGIVARLEAMGGRHLVVVRYGPRHNVHTEWVNNDADIDAASVIWAREMDAAQNRALVEYFEDRRVWLLTPDDLNAPLRPYPAAAWPDGAVSR